MIDVLTVTTDGRLAVVELKADEDIHLPLQGLTTGRGLHGTTHVASFSALDTFRDGNCVSRSSLLFLVAPALHVHPATDTLLHYISPEVDWTLLGIDERWRDGVRVVSQAARREI